MLVSNNDENLNVIHNDPYNDLYAVVAESRWSNSEWAEVSQ